MKKKKKKSESAIGLRREIAEDRRRTSYDFSAICRWHSYLPLVGLFGEREDGVKQEREKETRVKE